MKVNVHIRIVGIVLLVIILCCTTGTISAGRFSMSYLYGRYDYSNLVTRTNGALNEVSPSYFDLYDDGSLKLNTVDTEFIEEMHSQGVKVVPFLSNHWDRELGRNALDNIEALSTQIANAISTYNLDGVNIDIENVTGIDTRNYTLLVKTIREKLQSDKTVSVAVAANPYGWTSGWHASYDYEELSKYADYLMIMTYDEHYESGEAGPVSSIQFVEKSIKYALSKTTKDKIVIGIPFYGRYWKNGSSYGGYGVSINKINQIVSKYSSVITYDEYFKSAKAIVTIRDSDMKPTINGRTLYAGTYTFWYENEESIKAKLALINEYDLKGAGSWSLGQESVDTWTYYKEALEIETGMFIDVATSRWSSEAIEKVKENGWMNGRTDNKFAPGEPLTRAEFATIIARVLGLENYNEVVYLDIDGHWAKEYINAISNEGLMNGYEDDTFKPEKYITRAEVAKVLSKISSKIEEKDIKVQFSDVIEESWAYNYIVDAVKKGLMEGYEDNSFRENNTITREEIATVLVRYTR